MPQLKKPGLVQPGFQTEDAKPYSSDFHDERFSFGLKVVQTVPSLVSASPSPMAFTSRALAVQ
jgi:hypothetical protein